MNANLRLDARVLTDVRGTLHLEREDVTWTPSSRAVNPRTPDELGPPETFLVFAF